MLKMLLSFIVSLLKPKYQQQCHLHINWVHKFGIITRLLQTGSKKKTSQQQRWRGFHVTNSRHCCATFELYECELQKLRCGQVIDGLIVTRWDFSAFDCSNALVFLFQRSVNQHCGHTDENIQWLQHHRIKLQSTLFSQHFFD